MKFGTLNTGNRPAENTHDLDAQSAATRPWGSCV